MNPNIVGRLTAIRRYPVKSMRGENLTRAEIDSRGLAGDRRFALIDWSNGMIASAKNPRKWPSLLDAEARYVGGDLRIVLPDGSTVSGDDPGADAQLSLAFGREVSLRSAATGEARIEVVSPADAESDTEEILPAGSFFDLAPLHLLTTATLRRLAELGPASRFDPARFRPNLIVETETDREGFVEDDWIGRILRIGDAVRLRITARSARCIMTTLRQPGWERDPGVLRVAAEFNGACVGVYAEVLRAGPICEGDTVILE